MGCASSKRVEATVAADIYRPPPTSIALFDISKIEEPWLITAAAAKQSDYDTDDDTKKPQLSNLPLPILEKLDSFDAAPKSWSEVSKALEDLKPTLNQQTNKQAAAPLPPKPTVEPPQPPSVAVGAAGYRPVKDNSFILRDRLERESKKGGEGERNWRPKDPFEGFIEKRPPGNETGVVIYTTTLRGVRRTFEDCEETRRVVESHAVEAEVEVEERDVSLHGEFLRELREIVGEEAGAAVPRVFVWGRYVGGAAEVAELGDTGKLREMMRWAARRGMGGGKGKAGRRQCEGCGGARFVPCLECSGSCKVVADGSEGVVRCDKCNENGLVMCPLCH